MHPDHLYKFRSLDGDNFERTRRILAEDELWFARASTFNDPFDCNPALSLEATGDEYRKWLGGIQRKRTPHLSRLKIRALVGDQIRDFHKMGPEGRRAKLRELMEEIDELVGVLSLVERCDHVLMWSHYADSHRGLCLRFKVPREQSFFGEARKVVYSPVRPVLNPVKDKIEEMVEKALLTKAESWRYEAEWRVIDRRSPHLYGKRPGPGLHRWLLPGCGVLASLSHQGCDEGSEKGFATAPGVVHELEEAEVERQPLL